jgi:hypothetical protein
MFALKPCSADEVRDREVAGIKGEAASIEKGTGT